MAPIRFPAGATLGGAAVGGRFASASGYRTARYVGPNGSVVSLASRFPQIIAGLNIRTRVASREAAQRILEDARERVPQPGMSRSGRSTGALRDSLYLEELDIAEDSAVASDLEYAPYVEFGTMYQGAQPYLIPSMEAERGPYIAATTAALQRL